MLLRAAKLVACPGGGSTVIPEFRLDSPGRSLIAVFLRDHQLEGLIILVVIVAGIINKMGDVIDYRRIIQIFHIRDRVDFYP